MSTPAPPQPSRYSLGSTKNLLYSLLAVVGIMVLLVLLVPRVNSISGPPVDIHASAVAVQQESGWPIVEAKGLPEGWSATSARYVRATGDFMTWHAGYQTPSGTYVAVEQTMNPTQAWIEAQTNRAPTEGRMEVAGKSWAKLVRDTKTQNSLLYHPDDPNELTTLVTGTATFEDIAFFIEHLQPVAG